MSETLFLSTVTSEFGAFRARLARFLDRIKTIHVRHQDDFFHSGVKTLHMLEEEIVASDFIMHIIGAEPGWSPPVDQVEAFLHVHSAVEGPDGNVWFAAAFKCQINKFDPRTKKFSAYRPPSCGKDTGNGDEGGEGPSEVRVDRLGNVWANAGNLWRFDPKTEKFTEFPEGGDAYGFVLDQKEGNVWFAQLWAGKIGEVDIKTLKLKRWTPPATLRLAETNKDQPDEVGNTQVHPKSAGPRRISSDSKGMIWFGEWFAGQLARFDPSTETFKEFPLPGPAPTPYGVGVDRNDFVWYASYDNDTLGRLDPNTGKVLEYPLPYSGNGIREILQDVDGRMWFGTSFNNKVGYFIPPEGLKSN